VARGRFLRRLAASFLNQSDQNLGWGYNINLPKIMPTGLLRFNLLHLLSLNYLNLSALSQD